MSTIPANEQNEFDQAWQQEAPDGHTTLDAAQKAAEQMQAREQAAADYSTGWTAG